MQAILKFKLPEEQEEYELAVNGGKANAALFDVRQEIFRPARKHGFSDKKIQDLIERLDAHANPETGDNGATHLISLLEDKFSEILAHYGVTEI